MRYCSMVVHNTFVFFHLVDSAFVKLLKYSEYKMHIGSIVSSTTKRLIRHRPVGHNSMLNIGLLNLKTPGGS